MIPLSEVMTRDVESVSAESTLRELAEFFAEEDVSGAPVTSRGKVVGVVSVTDLIQFDAEGRGAPAYEAMQSTNRAGDDARWSPEAGDGPPAYFAQPWEEAGELVRTRIESEGPLWSSLEEHTVDEVMTRELLTLSPNADVREAARAMIDADVHRLLVMDDQALAGHVTKTDIVRAVADRGLGA